MSAITPEEIVDSASISAASTKRKSLWRLAIRNPNVIIGGTILITQGLKEAFPSRRPDGSDNKSFPSGHTSTSFAAAATLHNRYGWEAGLPAYVVASFVGLSRVEARKHRVGDVLVGAAIGTATGHLITTKANDRIRIVPWGDSKSAGVDVSLRF